MGKQTFEEIEASQEKEEGKVTNEAVKTAQENIARKKAEKEVAIVQSCIEKAEQKTSAAAIEGRCASKKRNILKKYTEGLNDALETLKVDGDVKKYNDTISKLEDEKDEAMDRVHREIYGW